MTNAVGRIGTEAPVNERTVVICSGLIGAALGALAGYLFLTESGRQLRRDLEPRLDDLARDFVALQGSVSRATDAAQQGWRAINEATGGRRQGWTDADQTAPY
jgi:gas vesicle protein